MKKVYLDHNSSTPVHPAVIEAMRPYWREVFGNASSTHQSGRQARKAIEDAREKTARVIGADPQEMIFTSGGTESDNLAVKGAVQTAGAVSRLRAMSPLYKKSQHA